jgi:hypothetical protein
MGLGICDKTEDYKPLFNPVIKTCDQFMVFLNEGNVYPRKNNKL